MTPPKDPIKLLRASKRLQTDAEFGDFEEAVALLAERLDPADLVDIHLSFDDAIEDYELFWSLVHLIDGYDYAASARAFVAVLPETLLKAREWMKLLAVRQLNHEDARRLLIEAGQASATPSRSALAELLAELTTERGTVQQDALALKAEAALAALRAS